MEEEPTGSGDGSTDSDLPSKELPSSPAPSPPVKFTIPEDAGKIDLRGAPTDGLQFKIRE